VLKEENLKIALKNCEYAISEIDFRDRVEA
jgi:hypothetical protein